MSGGRSKLSSKERIGYEVFFFTAVYGLYNVFFANPVLVDGIVFTFLFGSLFVRYHLVVSDEDLSDSTVARWTGTGMFVVAVAIPAHLGFRTLSNMVQGIGTEFDQYLVLVGSAFFAVMLFAVFNYRVFRDDAQRQETYKEKAGEDSPTGLIADTGIFLEQQTQKGNYDTDIKNSLDIDETRRLIRKTRKGEITSRERDQLHQKIKKQRDAGHIFVIGFHVLVSVALLLVFTALVEALTTIEAIETLSLILLVTGVYYSFLLLHTRFGLRKNVTRTLPKMPMELLLCIFAVFASLSNANVIGGEGIIITVPFTLYLLSNWGGVISQKMVLGVMKYFVDTPDDEYKDVVREVLQDESS